jgi:photosystem II stability/assembly factor-like uncharacterized protein
MPHGLVHHSLGRDRGAHWQALPNLPMLGGLRFATSSVGYLFGSALLMTTDGGLSWNSQPGPSVEALTVADGEVFRVAYNHTGCPGPCNPTLQEAQIGSTTWRTLVGQLAQPGRNSSAQIVASGSALLLALYGSQAGPTSAQASVYRSTDVGSSWQLRTDPCSGLGPAGVEEDLIYLANATGGFFAGLCTPHVGTGGFVVTSSDGGGSWQRAGSLPTAEPPLALLAAASPSTFALSSSATSGAGPFTAQLFVSTDAGRHWTLATSDAQQVTSLGVSSWLGFETAQVGRWIGDPHSIWTTNDGGEHWNQSPFR